MVNQETGVRGFVLGGQEGFLDPYRTGVANAARAQRQLETLARAEMSGRLPRDLAAAQRAIAAWESGYARPTIERIRRFGAGRIENAAVAAGKARFDIVRASLGRLQADLRADRADARADLRRLLRRSRGTGLRRDPARSGAGGHRGDRPAGHRRPLARLARQTRAVAGGDLHRAIEPSGPSDIERLGRDVESMRERIVRDLEAVAPPSGARSSRPSSSSAPTPSSSSSPTSPPTTCRSRCARWRASASCSSAATRASSTSAADQYIAFAVDGAKRMQALINDLLAFSRVGRIERPARRRRPRRARRPRDAHLSRRDRGRPAPSVERIGRAADRARRARRCCALRVPEPVANAIKFHAPTSRRCASRRARDGDVWEFAVADNGIGIDPEYADRIFVIFQRLHAARRLRGHRHRARDVPQDRRVPRRADLARRRAEHGGGSTFRFTPAGRDDARRRPR